MTKDINGKTVFDSDEEKALYEAHMAEFGPATGKSHRDDCEYCKKMGWDTHPEKSRPGKAFDEHMSDFGPATGKSHPDDCEYCESKKE